MPAQTTLIEELVEMEPEKRGHHLMMFPEKQRNMLLQSWTEDDRFRLSMTFDLPTNFKVRTHQILTGKAFKGLPASNRLFYVKPAIDGDVIKLENGSKDNNMRYITIDKPTPLQANKAIQALQNWGKDAPIKSMRDRLIEISEQDFGAWSYQKQQEEKAAREAQEAAKLALEEGVPTPKKKGKGKKSVAIATERVGE